MEEKEREREKRVWWGTGMRNEVYSLYGFVYFEILVFHPPKRPALPNSQFRSNRMVYDFIFYSFLSPHPTPKTNSGLALLQTGPNCCGTLEHPSAFQNKTSGGFLLLLLGGKTIQQRFIHNHRSTTMPTLGTTTPHEPLLLPSQDDGPPQPSSPSSYDYNNNYYYEWPNVFDESYEMILAAIMIYGVVDLRILCQRGILTPSCHERLQQLPLSSQEIIDLVLQNRAIIEDEIGHESTELYLDAFEYLDEYYNNNNNNNSENNNDDNGDYDVESGSGVELQWSAARKVADFVSFDFVVVDDEHSNTELVYGICVHHSRRRITVIFRGCTTRKDWAISVETFLTEHSFTTPSTTTDTADTPLPTTMGIHRGFHRYLFGQTKNNSNCETPLDDSSSTHRQQQQQQQQQPHQKSKFESILDKLRGILQIYPDYQVYVTGHSLGGALATFFAFELASLSHSFQSEPNSNASYLPTVITCIPIASPMVGNLNFERAFQELEHRGFLRCLRVTNHLDIFTQLPDRTLEVYALACCCVSRTVLAHYYLGTSFAYFLCCQHRVYRHVGMELQLYRKKKGRHLRYKLQPSHVSSTNYVWRVLQDWKKHSFQMIQRLLAVPFAVCCCCLGDDWICCNRIDFNANHSAQEHMQRLKALSFELDHIFLNDLYDEQRHRNR